MQKPLSELGDLLAQIEAVLRQHPQGLGEYELLKALQAESREGFREAMFRDSHALFQAHFLLFHALYRLDDELRRSTGEGVEIDVLKIQLRPTKTENTPVPVKRDPLRDYYADLANLQQTSAEDVEQLLGAFWVKYYANERRAEALAVLGLCDPVEMERITQRYRKLAMEHHPDRGGEPERFKQLQEAMSLLRRC